MLYLVRHKRELHIHSPEVKSLNSHKARDPDTGDSWLETVVDATGAGLKLLEGLGYIISIAPAEPGIYASPDVTLVIDHDGGYTIDTQNQ